MSPKETLAQDRQRSGAPQGVAVHCEAVTKTYQLDKVAVQALSGVTCSLQQGCTSFIIGPSGSGKSTLLNILGLIDRPSSGRVTLFGREVTGLSDRAAVDFRAKHIGFIFQSFNLIPVLSVLENVEFPLMLHPLSAQERRERAEKYLAAVGLSAMMDRRPGEISGGQRQRAAIARALVAEPDLIVAGTHRQSRQPHLARDHRALKPDASRIQHDRGGLHARNLPHSSCQPGARNRRRQAAGARPISSR